MNDEYLKFAKEVAYEAGKIMLQYFKKDNGATYKQDKTIVTLADTKINDYLIQKVKETFPNHCVDGEEESFGKSNYVWVCDPIDGTAMYARHIPVSVFSLALVIDGKPKIGVVYDPFLDELYEAQEGKGAYKNNHRITVNELALEDKKAVSHFDMWPRVDSKVYDVIKELGEKTYFVSIGSIIRACMCVARGEFVAGIFPGTKHKNCDIAAAKIIVEEAGGTVTNFWGEEQRYDQDIEGAIITNGKVHEEIVETIRKCLKNENFELSRKN